MPASKVRSDADCCKLPARVAGIIDAVAVEDGVSVADLLGPSQRIVHSDARRKAWARIRDLQKPDRLPFSYPQIGRWFGRHHTTVLIGVQAVRGER